MFEPFLDLMADAADTTATLLALLAIWQGRAVRCKEILARWLGLRPVERRVEVEDFVRKARVLGHHRPASARGAALTPR